MITSNRRIFLAITLSLLLFFGIKYLYINPQILRPENIYASVIQKPVAKIKTIISSIRLPDLTNFKKLFTLNFSNSNNNETMKQWNNESNNSFNFPTAKPQSNNQAPNGAWQPTPTNSNQNCTGQACLTPTSYSKPIPTKIPIKIPTAIPQPTAIPRPTAIPQPTDIPAPEPITSDVRPGTTLTEIFEEVNKRMCIPVALLMAFQTEETGAWIKIDEPASFITMYNTYGWWTTASADPCKGFGYDELTGMVPSDSYYAGKICKKTPGANPSQMGLFSLNQWEQDTSRKNTITTLPNNIDRRVLFDDTIIFASITKNRVGNLAPDSCDDWPDDVIRLAAEKHQGSCGNNYCDDVLKYYKQYK